VDVRTFTVGPVQENCFLFRRDGSDRALIVDPGDEAPRILGAVEQLGVSVEAILVTTSALSPRLRRRRARRST
jgi:hydroxyacylglutathione hydrolase